MRLVTLAIAAANAALLASAAAAEEPTATCDYFLNATTGTRCAQTFGVSVGAGTSSFRHSYRYDDPPYFAFNETDRSDVARASAGVSVTPTGWLTLSYSGAWNRSTYRLTDYTSLAYWPSQQFSAKASASAASNQTLAANVNLLDTGAGAQRYVVNGLAGWSFIPQHDVPTIGGPPDHTVGSNSYGYGGLVATARWQLGHSDFAIEAQGTVEFLRWKDDASYIGPAARLLVSNDTLGLAVGPTLNSSYLVKASNGYSIDYGASTQVTNVGGTMIYQPFRSGSMPLLSGLILQGSAQHSVGREAGIGLNGSKSDSISLSATATFNFRY